MVNLATDRLNRTFAALADPTRRALLARLRRSDELPVSVLARPFAMTLPAVMKHLDLLSEAGLISRTKQGRVVSCKLTPEPLDGAMTWLEQHRRFWDGSLDRLQKKLDAKSEASLEPRSKKPVKRGVNHG